MSQVYHARSNDTPKDPASVKDIIQRRNKAFDDIDVRKITLYTAYVNEGYSLRSLARQTKKSVRDIRRSINFVYDRLKCEFPAYVEQHNLDEQFPLDAHND